MLQTPRDVAHAAAKRRTAADRRPATDRRPAVWPWLLMPVAVLALFFALRSVRHSTDSSPLGQGSEVSGDPSAQ
jgi:hypothetical protein